MNGDRWKILTEPNREKQVERDKAKLARELEEIQKTCPFKPQLQNRVNRSLGNSRSHNQLRDSFMSISSSQTALPERLMQEADRRKENREKLKRELDIKMMQECSFQPNLITKSTPFVNKNKLDNGPIHTRIDEITRERNERMQALRMKNEMDRQESFIPQINKRSDKIAQVKNQNDYCTGTVTERLYNDASTRLERARSKPGSVRAATTFETDESCTFKPNIGNFSRQMTE